MLIENQHGNIWQILEILGIFFTNHNYNVHVITMYMYMYNVYISMAVYHLFKVSH